MKSANLLLAVPESGMRDAIRDGMTICGHEVVGAAHSLGTLLTVIESGKLPSVNAVIIDGGMLAVDGDLCDRGVPCTCEEVSADAEANVTGYLRRALGGAAMIVMTSDEKSRLPKGQIGVPANDLNALADRIEGLPKNRNLQRLHEFIGYYRSARKR